MTVPVYKMAHDTFAKNDAKILKPKDNTLDSIENAVYVIEAFITLIG